jgi:hypothetical protein
MCVVWISPARICLTTLAVILLEARLLGNAAPARDCTTALSKDQSDLPKLGIASPKDRPPYCITLETLMAFAGRVKAHIAHCPNSDFAAGAADWAKTQADYSKLFSQHRCKRTM